MELTLLAYEKKTVNFSGGFFTVLSVNGELELSARGIEDIPIEAGDQINLGDVPSFVLQNITETSVVIKYTTGSKPVNKKSQVTRTEIINETPIKVQFDDAFTVGAVTQSGAWSFTIDAMPAVDVNSMPAVDVNSMPALNIEAMPAISIAAAATASDPINITLAAGQSAEILPINANRHTATIVRGELDLYNIKLAYGSAVNAQNGISFAPQATAKIQSKASVWVHNHSDVPQAIIAIDTSIL